MDFSCRFGLLKVFLPSCQKYKHRRPYRTNPLRISNSLDNHSYLLDATIDWKPDLLDLFRIFSNTFFSFFASFLFGYEFDRSPTNFSKRKDTITERLFLESRHTVDQSHKMFITPTTICATPTSIRRRDTRVAQSMTKPVK